MFFKEELSFLGYTLNKAGCSPDKKKYEVIQNWPFPTTTKELRNFVGFAGYYRQFIPCFSDKIRPLEHLLNLCNSYGNKKTTNINITDIWQPKHDAAFNNVKEALISKCILAYPKPGGHFILDTDASAEGIGAVLSQIHDGKEKVIWYASRSLTKCEKKYCTTRRELLAIYKFVKQFKHYLIARKFTIRTDHEALQWLLRNDRPTTSQYFCWRSELQLYEFEVVHRAGNKHINADMLSRLPAICGQCPLRHTDPQRKRNYKAFEENSSNSSTRDAELINTVAQSSMEDIKNWCLRNQVKKTEEEHILSKQLLLVFKDNDLFLKTRNQMRKIVPPTERTKLIRDFHTMLCHLGTSHTLRTLEREFYWKGMGKEVHEFVGHCEFCLRAKDQCKPKVDLIPSKCNFPFQRIALDITGPLPLTQKRNRYILGISDYFSKLAILIPLKDISAKTVATKVFTQWISRYGPPLTIHTDQVKNFESDLFHQFCKLYAIKKTKTTAYHPQGDGMVERLFRTIKPLINATCSELRVQWDEALPHINLALMNIKKESTGFSSSEIVFGRSLFLNPDINSSLNKESDVPEYIREHRCFMKIVQKKVEENQTKYNSKMADRYNPVHEKLIPRKGDLVFVKIPKILRKNLGDKYSGPYVVISEAFNNVCKLKCINTNKVISKNVCNLKLCSRSKEYNKQNNSFKNKSFSTPATVNRSISTSLHAQTSTDDIKENSKKQARRERRSPKRYGFDTNF